MQHAARKPFQKPHASTGAIWRIIAAAAPLVIGEFVKDQDKRWRYIRLVSLVATIGTTASWQWRVKQEREAEKESRHDGGFQR